MRNLQKFVLLIIVFLNINLCLCNDITEWICKSGESIALEELCDGHRNCSDGSDELAEICLHIPCPIFAFKCSYGACVDRSVACNNITDCVDNSDEATTLCQGRKTTARPLPRN